MTDNTAQKPIAALIYDFDKTLSPRDQQEYSFIPGINMEPEDFWNSCREAQLKHGMDSVLAYMLMMLEKSRGTGLLTRASLEKLGKSVEFFPGVEDWFGRINLIGEENGVTVEHYIISSGLKEIIGGSRIAGEFKAVFAASFFYGEDGLENRISICIFKGFPCGNNTCGGSGILYNVPEQRAAECPRRFLIYIDFYSFIKIFNKDGCCLTSV